MIRCRKGVIGLPVRLMVSFLIITLMVPFVVDAVDDIRGEINDGELYGIAEDLGDQISRVHSKGTRYISQMDLEIPDGTSLVIGDDGGMTIGIFRGDSRIGHVILDCPVVSDRMELYGDVILRIYNSEDGVAVKEL